MLMLFLGESTESLCELKKIDFFKLNVKQIKNAKSLSNEFQLSL